MSKQECWRLVKVRKESREARFWRTQLEFDAVSGTCDENIRHLVSTLVNDRDGALLILVRTNRPVQLDLNESKRR
jgi:hypothetical protein